MSWRPALPASHRVLDALGLQRTRRTQPPDSERNAADVPLRNVPFFRHLASPSHLHFTGSVAPKPVLQTLAPVGQLFNLLASPALERVAGPLSRLGPCAHGAAVYSL